MRDIHPIYCLAILLAHAVASPAQHIDIMVWDADGQLGVGQYDYDNLVASETRVHLARFDAFYSVNNPGYTAFAGPDALPGNTDLLWDFVPMTVDSGPHVGYESTLLYWNGEGITPEFGPTPTDAYEFSIFGQNGPGVADGCAEVTPGGVIDTTPPNGAIHEHLYYFLDDNGDGLNTTLPDTGIYVVGMRLRIAGLYESEPFFLVWATPELEILPAIRPAALWINDRVDTLFVDSLTGDFNADGAVNAADYSVWRNSYGQTGGSLAADSNGDEVVNGADYAVWRENFDGAMTSPATTSTVPAPEPSASLLLVVYFMGVGGVPRRLLSLGAR